MFFMDKLKINVSIFLERQLVYMPGSYDIVIGLLLSCLLGGLVGMERESINRPAGLRTHILVCVGSTLVMLSGIYLFHQYKLYTNLDPARLGAQVISGIGFLGAGTIIKEGSTVRGLTTAASLWTVSGIGIAIGSGFYLGAILTTVFILTTLIFFSRVERYVASKHNGAIIKLHTSSKPGQLGMLGTELGKLNVSITNIKMESLDDTTITIILQLIIPRNVSIGSIVEKISKLEGIYDVECL